MPAQHNIDSGLLNAALEGLESQLRRIDSQIAEIKRRLGSQPTAVSIPAASARRRTLSDAARRRIAAAQKKRWKAYHQSKQPKVAKGVAAKSAPVRKRRLSAAGRKLIAEAARKRWAAYRKQKTA